jgi:putative Holliday junction resolvase
MASLIGLDYGLRRIGIAVSDEAGRLAFALETHVEGRDPSIIRRLEQLISERSAERIVVGLPLTAAGDAGEMAGRAERFAARLREALAVEVTLWDERFSSAEADRWLALRRKPGKEDRDALAAQIILQSYLDRLRAGEGEVPGC